MNKDHMQKNTNNSIMELSPEMNAEGNVYVDEEDLFLTLLKKNLGEEFTFNLQTSSDFSPYIIVDKREHRSGIFTELKELGATVFEEVLEAGDYLLSSKVAVERKRGDDFYGSLFSGSNKTNIFEELMRLTDSVDSPMLILEDFQRMFKRGDSMISSLYGAMVSIATTMKISIIPTRNISDTALVLFRIAKQQQSERIEKSIARRAPKKMSLKDRQTFFVEGFFNVGPTKAAKIIEEFSTPLNFIDAILNTEVLYTRTGNPKGIDGELKRLKGFSWKFVLDNQKLLDQDDDQET